MKRTMQVLGGWLACGNIAVADDILVADFEGENYGNWVVQGEAFGPGPARGTLKGQIVDQATGGWGHINVDHIVQTDVKPKVPEVGPQAMEFKVTEKFLVIPIRNGAKKTDLVVEIDGKAVRRYSTELATDPGQVDWYAFFTIESYKGKKAKVKAARANAEAFGLVREADAVPGSENWYDEPLRPQLRFTQAVGWNNDPNGMVYLHGEWHLFFQHNPVGWKWGNMTWGHAVSRDLVHWEQLPNVLFPGTMAKGACFSGGATIDPKNTAGWKTGDNDVLVAFLTDTGAGEAVAYSNDKGRTFTWFKGNPVVKHKGRDPKVIWYAYDKSDQPLDAKAKELGGHWVMAIYDEHPQHKRNIVFYTSVDLKAWQKQSHLPGYFECPELFELNVEGEEKSSRWIVLAADAKYALGSFDGRTFTPEHQGKHQVHWGPYYASQCFDNAPDGRRIQIGWVRIASPGMPFNQTFSFPHELTLHHTADGLRMFARPVAEIEKLHRKKHAAAPVALADGDPASMRVSGELFEIRAAFQLGAAKQVGLKIGGNKVVYDVVAGKLNGVPLKPVDGVVSMQILVDRTILETCGNDGRVFITAPRKVKGEIKVIEAFAAGGPGKLERLEIYELNSIWK